MDNKITTTEPINMPQLWRLQTRTNAKIKIAEYCRKEKIIAIGWSLKDEHLEAEGLTSKQISRNEIDCFEKYCEKVKQYNIFGGKVNENVTRFSKEIKNNDLIYIRDNGIYYLGRKTKDSELIYNGSTEALENDASIQITKIEWVAVGDESDVPGDVATSFYRRKNITKN